MLTSKSTILTQRENLDLVCFIFSSIIHAFTWPKSTIETLKKWHHNDIRHRSGVSVKFYHIWSFFSVSIVTLEQLNVFGAGPSFIMLNALLEKYEEPALFTLGEIYRKKLVKGDIG